MIYRHSLSYLPDRLLPRVLRRNNIQIEFAAVEGDAISTFDDDTRDRLALENDGQRGGKPLRRPGIENTVTGFYFPFSSLGKFARRTLAEKIGIRSHH
jgi:hypothetical protein